MKKIIVYAYFLLNNLFAFSQDTSFVEFKFTGMDGKEATEKSRKINFIGTVYPRIYEKKVDGNYFNGLRFKDSIIVLNLWGTFCKPCIAEMPGLNKLKEDYKNKPIVFVAITISDPKQVYESFISNNRFTFFHLFINDLDKMYNFYMANGFPTTIIIDKNSRVSYMKSGGSIEEDAPKLIYDELEKELEKLLK